MQLQVAPSILSADFLNLGKDIEMLNRNADLIHLDIMDGSFVPNISFGFPVVEAVSRVATIPMDAHLMVVNPENWFERLASCGVQMISFHLETSGSNTKSYIDRIHSLGCQAGVAIDPDVDVEDLFKYAAKADYFLIMSVFAGFGGQKFIYESLDRISRLKAKLIKCGSEARIEVDGGVGESNIKALKEAGADIVVAGSSVFKAKDPAAVISNLKI